MTLVLVPAHASVGWTLIPEVVIYCVGASITYTSLVIRRARVHHRIAWQRIASWFVGVALVAIALMSPMDALAHERSLTLHMVQHELLLTVAPLFLLMGLDSQLLAPLTRWIFRPALQHRGTTRALRGITAPALALSAWSAAVAVWSLPATVALAYRNDLVHEGQHIVSFVLGLLFWAVILTPYPTLHRLGVAAKLACLGAVNVVAGLVAGALAFAPSSLYAVPYGSTGERWLGLAPMADQRLAAAVMMAVCMATTLTAAVWVVSRSPLRARGTRPGVAPEADFSGSPSAPAF